MLCLGKSNKRIIQAFTIGFLIVGFLFGVMRIGTVRANSNPKIDVPGPKITPLIDPDQGPPDITSLVNNYQGPGVYAVEVAPDMDITVVVRWCTKTQDILNQNLEHIQYAFDLNGSDKLAGLHNFEEVDQDESGETMYCHGYRGMISDWPSGSHTIRYSLTFDSVINDGWDDYPAGEIAWEFTVTVSSDLSGDSPQISPLVEGDTETPNITDLAKGYVGPGLYTIEIQPDGEVSVVIRWCTRTQDILEQNLEHTQFSFGLNGRDELARLHNFDDVDQDELGAVMYCHGYRGVISKWPAGDYKINYGLSFDEKINDGWDDYPAGELTWEFAVNVPDTVDTADKEVETTSGVPMVSVSLNTNCRQGPSTEYEIVGDLEVGEVAEVVGKSQVPNYWIIIEPRLKKECWLWGEYAEVTGDTSQLKVYTPPPLPTATPTPTPRPDQVNSICFCNHTGDYISTLKLFNDDTDEWVAELGSDGFDPGFCYCHSTGGPYPFGDYAIQYRVCTDGAACTTFGDPITQSFEVHTERQGIDINP